MPNDTSPAVAPYLFKDNWDASPFMTAQGLTSEEVSTGEVALFLRNPTPAQRGAGGPPDAINGGVISYMFDGALGYAIVSAQMPQLRAAGADLAGYSQVTINLDITYLTAARGSAFKAAGRVLRVGRGTAFAEGELLNDQGEVCATAKGIWRIFWPRGAASTSGDTTL
ncbi:PaaI family thioesterase [Algiphilus sp. W345]|uniref:PaaI family thioesterase n=1 Tax=Banduia mediterranea TaxID=3075609 RepID=A0ABU2WEX0_9GAMM|nr:PaaI family thioesterase [Algiphilus sp. W345]MDT0496415.1 PaaI family thioesterase [Algiphilus sp. W345]